MFHIQDLDILRTIFLTSEIARNPDKTKVVGIRIALQVMGVIGLLLCLKTVICNEFTASYSLPLYSGLLMYFSAVVLFRKGKLKLSSWMVVLIIWITLTLILVLSGEIDSFVFYANFLLIFIVGIFLYDIQVLFLIALIIVSVSLYFWIEEFPVLFPALIVKFQNSITILHTLFLILAAIIARGIGRALDRVFDRSERMSQQLQAIFYQSADAIFLTDLNFTILEMNPRAAELVEQAPEEVIGKNLKDYIPQEAKIEAEELANDTLVKGRISKIKMAFETQDGSLVHIQISANLIYQNDETPDHIQIILRDITERKLVEERIQRLALQDHLTKVDNRLSLNYRINSLIAKMSRDGGRFALVYFDLDNFKSVNDRYGHYIGDQLLIAFTKRLHGATRDEDFLARMGGDEFVLVLENFASDNDLETTLKRIAKTLAGPFKIGEHLIYLEASYGVSRYPEDGDDFEVLLKCADSAMYTNKRTTSPG